MACPRLALMSLLCCLLVLCPACKTCHETTPTTSEVEALTRCSIESGTELVDATQLASHDPIIFVRIRVSARSLSSFLHGCDVSMADLEEATQYDVEDMQFAGANVVDWWAPKLSPNAGIVHSDEGSWRRTLLVDDTSAEKPSVYIRATK